MKKRRNIVVVGIGYVGFPLSCVLAAAGYKVVGVDINRDKVARINRRELPFDYPEKGLERIFRRVRIAATNDFEPVAKADAVIIAVETPVDEKSHRPGYAALKSALKSVGKYLRSGTLVIIESTVAPFTTSEVVVPVLEKVSGLRADKDFYVVHCPERISPTETLYKLVNMPRVIGGYTDKAGKMAAEIYRSFVKADIDVVSATTAEVVKTAGNAYRDVQIAFANELESICREYGVDFWKVRELVNKEPERNVHRAGVGVGGHCIPKDSWLLLSGLGKSYGTLIKTGRKINQSRPKEMFDRLLDALEMRKLQPPKAKIAVLGVSYLPGTDDARNSPTLEFVKLLKEKGLNFKLHDQCIKDYNFDLNKILDWANIIAIMTEHEVYRKVSSDSRNIL